MADAHPRPVERSTSPTLHAEARARLDALERRHSSDGDDFTTHASWTWYTNAGEVAPSDWSTWLDDSPVAFWPLIADLLDVSGNDHHLSAASGSYLVGGGLTGAATFTSTAAISGAGWTAEAVLDCNADDYSPSVAGDCVVAEGTTGAGLIVYDGPGLGQPFWFGGPGFTIGAGPYESASIRHHVAVVCSAASTLLYIDGALYVANSAGPAASGGNLYVGVTFGTFGTFTPSKSYVAIYPSALSADRIAAHAAAAGFTP